jgi:hypothetical protein
MTTLALQLAFLLVQHHPGLPALSLRAAFAHAPLLAAAAAEHNQDAFVLAAIVRVESHHNPSAIGRDGECGLAQVLPRVAVVDGKKVPCAELLKPRPGVRAGARVLKRWMVRAHGDTKVGVAAYNAGGAVLDPTCNTKRCKRGRAYSEQVLTLASAYRRAVLSPWRSARTALVVGCGKERSLRRHAVPAARIATAAPGKWAPALGKRAVCWLARKIEPCRASRRQGRQAPCDHASDLR